MKKILWQDSLSVGIELIDSQHKQWIEHFNNAAQAVTFRQNQSQISKTLGFLMDYTVVHFTTEEKHMAQNNYPGLQEHKAMHDRLRSTLAGLVKDFEDEGVSPKLFEAIDTFLGNWLIQHIQEVDMKFGVFVRENRIVIS
jgi:hemerythrin